MQSILSFICIGCKDIALSRNCSNDACEDKMQSKKCQKLKNKGKCFKRWVAKKCPKTCNLCDKGKTLVLNRDCYNKKTIELSY